MLKTIGVSRSGFYSYKKNENLPTQTQIRKEHLQKEIKKIHEGSYGIYGSPKITVLLNKNGENVSQKHVYNLMHGMGIKARYVRHYTKTTVSEDYSSKMQNLLNRHFNPTKPNTVWCTDITYIWTREDGFVYLTSVMDLFSRRIIAWVLTRTMDADKVLECLIKAKERRETDHPIVIQSDRGVQYTSELYQRLTEGMVTSYSWKGTPWDNACIESFHSLIKREWLQFYKIDNYYGAYKIVFEYIEGFYNTTRIHSHCEYESPQNFEKQYLKHKH